MKNVSGFFNYLLKYLYLLHPGRTFPVVEFFLEDSIDLTKWVYFFYYMEMLEQESVCLLCTYLPH